MLLLLQSGAAIQSYKLLINLSGAALKSHLLQSGAAIHLTSKM